jgi:hypothetical protein
MSRYKRLFLSSDTGAEKKQLIESLGAEGWVDFAESKNLTEDVQKAADGLGPHAAVIAAGVVRSLLFSFCSPRSGFCRWLIEILGDTLQPSSHVSPYGR